MPNHLDHPAALMFDTLATADTSSQPETKWQWLQSCPFRPGSSMIVRYIMQCNCREKAGQEFGDFICRRLYTSLGRVVLVICFQYPLYRWSLNIRTCIPAQLESRFCQGTNCGQVVLHSPGHALDLT